MEVAKKTAQALECEQESVSGEDSAVVSDDDSEHVKGTPHKAARSVPMNIRYAAHMARLDLLRPHNTTCILGYQTGAHIGANTCSGLYVTYGAHCTTCKKGVLHNVK